MTRQLASSLHRRLFAFSAPQGFTLIELLIVVGIISILSAIAVPNFLEAQTRAKVSRMQADMRTVAVGLEAYAVDWNKYPPRTPRNPPLGGAPLFTFGDMNFLAEDMSAITTPVSYLSRVPVDIFETVVAPPNNLINYWDRENVLVTLMNAGPNQDYRYEGRVEWALFSVGPDADVGQSSEFGNYGYTSQFMHFFVDYDPTNGTISLGNVFRGPGNETGAEIFENL